jgi:predicted transcriptional regulator
MLRTYLDHNADILEMAKEGARKTQLVYGSNINFKLLKLRLAQLIETGLLLQEGRTYHTTPQGEVFLYHFKEMRSLIPIV